MANADGLVEVVTDADRAPELPNLVTSVVVAFPIAGERRLSIETSRSVYLNAAGGSAVGTLSPRKLIDGILRQASVDPGTASVQFHLVPVSLDGSRIRCAAARSGDYEAGILETTVDDIDVIAAIRAWHQPITGISLVTKSLDELSLASGRPVSELLDPIAT